MLEHFDDAHAAEMVADLRPATAAVVVDAMDSDEQADVLAELDDAEGRRDFGGDGAGRGGGTYASV